MYTTSETEFIDKLIDKLIVETAEYKLEWDFYYADSEESLNWGTIPYRKKHLHEDLSSNYQLESDRSLYAEVDYDEEHAMRFGLLRFARILEDNSSGEEKELMLVCDRMHKNKYTSLINTAIEPTKKMKLIQLYDLAIFKMNKDIQVIEQWLSKLNNEMTR